MILFVVSTALLLDNMLFMVIVPIITQILEKGMKGEGSSDPTEVALGSTDLSFSFNSSAQQVFNSQYDSSQAWLPDETKTRLKICRLALKFNMFLLDRKLGNRAKQGSEDITLGILFASKAIVQLIANTVTGSFIDRIGYEVNS